MTERDGGRRGEGRSTFSRSARNEQLGTRDRSVSLADANRIVRCADEVKEKVRAHHQRHEGTRTSTRYGELLVKHGLERAPMPQWAASDPQARLMARARASVASDLSHRLARVDRAQANMLKSGKVRPTRQPKWDRGLGE